MSPRLDEGDIVFQRKVRTRRSDSVSTLYDRIIEKSLSLVPRLTQSVRARKVPRLPQGERGASLFGATTDEDFRLDWSLPAAVLERRVRATPGRCFVEKDGRRLYVLDAEAWRGLRGKSAGTLTGIGSGRCVVSTGEGSLVIQSIRDENGRTIGAAEAREVIG
jgi:methionyl-tRNA formyltransferase